MRCRNNRDGLAEAFIIGEEFVGDDRVALVLGDNIFYGQSFSSTLKKVVEREEGATVIRLLCEESGMSTVLLNSMRR